MKKWLAVGIILLFIVVAVAPSINFNVAKASDDNDLTKEGNGEIVKKTHDSPERFLFFTYNSWVKIDYDKEYVNQTEFIPNNVYMIPAAISYKVDVPSWFLNLHFQFLKNWFLFHSFIGPEMIINVSAENVPTWAEIYPSTSNILEPISNEWSIAPFTLVVYLHNQAPPGPFVFTLTAKAPAIHRINGYFIKITIPITVQ